MKFIVALLTRRHSMYLDEIQDWLLVEHGMSACIMTLQMTLHCLSYSCKVVSARALERNDLLRSTFMNKIADVCWWGGSQEKDISESKRVVISGEKVCVEEMLWLWTEVFDPSHSNIGWYHHLWYHFQVSHLSVVPSVPLQTSGMFSVSFRSKQN